MKVAFLGQPLGDSDRVGDALRAALADTATKRLWIATAWAKRSGLGRIYDELRDFRARGGHSEIIVGVDEGGATFEGLRLTQELFDGAYVFHDRGPRTFHTKLYAAESPTTNTLIVGSGNLTVGGLFTNYETALVCTFEASDEGAADVWHEARAYFDRLLAMEACERLDDDLIESLERDRSVIVMSERIANKRRQSASTTARSATVGAVVAGLRGAPPSTAPPIEAEEFDSDDLLVESDDGSPSPAETGTAGGALAATTRGTVAARAGVPHAGAPGSIQGFFKALSANDVSLHGSPGQIIIPIGFLPFFGPLNVVKDESATGGPREEDAELTVDFVDGAFYATIATARVVLYEPGITHKRRNSEVRFTFRDRSILLRLSKDDVLEFRRGSTTRIQVERRPSGWRPAGFTSSTRYGLV